jgi:hypothetical protein
MARHDDAAELVKEGYSPRAIATEWGLPFWTVAQNLYTAVGRGVITRTEIFFSINDDESNLIALERIIHDNNLKNRWDFKHFLRERLSPQEQNHIEEYLLYFDLREAPLGDIYELLWRLERFLHMYIRSKLEETAGPEGFWRQIPQSIREECALMKERDDAPQDDPYSYTMFIHLRVIFDKKWAVLAGGLPKSFSNDKQGFLATVLRLNVLRNRVMHPVRDYRPSREDFQFISTFVQKMLKESTTGAPSRL